MARITVTIRPKISWWVYPYMYLLVLFCRIFQTEPDYDKFKTTIGHGVKTEVVR